MGGYNMSTVLITGGLGFIGLNVASELVNNGYKALLYDNLSFGPICKKILVM